MRHAIRATSPILAFIASSAALWSADATIDDLRVEAGPLSKSFKGGEAYTINQNGSTTTGTSFDNPEGTDATSNRRLEVSYLRGHLGMAGGCLWGVDVAVNRAQFLSQGVKVVDRTPVVDLQLGYGFAPFTDWDFELTAFGGFGWTYSDLTGAGISDAHVSSHYLEYGAQLASTIAIGGHLVLGVAVPYLLGDFHPSFSTSTSDGRTISASDRERNRGFGILGMIGIRF